MMRGILLIALNLVLLTGALAQTEEQAPWDKNYIDTAILGTWECDDVAMLKMMRTSRDYFLRPVITFRDREKYEVEREAHDWSWNFSQQNQEVEIADMEEMLLQSYRIKLLDERTLILMLGQQEIIFKKVQ